MKIKPVAISIKVTGTAACFSMIDLFKTVNKAARKAEIIPKIIPSCIFWLKVNMRYMAGTISRLRLVCKKLNFFFNKIGSINDVNKEMVAKQVNATETLECLIAP